MQGSQEGEGAQGTLRGDEESLQCAGGKKEKEVDMARGGKKEGAEEVTLPQGRVLVLSDSQVRHLMCFVPEIGSVGRGCVCRGPG